MNDTFPTNYIYNGKLLGEVVARYKKGNFTDSAFSSGGNTMFVQDEKQSKERKSADKKSDLQINQLFRLDSNALTWTINLRSNSYQTITLEDLALPFFYNNEEVENSRKIFEERVIEHQFVSGNNSFLFWERPSGGYI